jgi:AcrR family transcriptional regulator
VAKRVSDDLRAVDGRTPGARGRATRQKLLNATAELLEKTGYRDLTVIDIARRAGTSPATFYQYFGDVEEAILDLARALSDEGAAVGQLITTSSWKGAAGYTTAVALTDAFLDLWERHRAIWRVVDLATAEGDLRFQNIRTHVLNQVTTAMRDVIADMRAAKRHPQTLDPMAHAATLVSMLAHVAAHRYGFEFWGIKVGNIRSSVARIVFTSVTGRSAPD